MQKRFCVECISGVWEICLATRPSAKRNVAAAAQVRPGQGDVMRGGIKGGKPPEGKRVAPKGILVAIWLSSSQDVVFALCSLCYASYSPSLKFKSTSDYLVSSIMISCMLLCHPSSFCHLYYIYNKRIFNKISGNKELLDQ